MKITALTLLIVAAVAASGQTPSDSFPGTLTLPAGYTMRRTGTIDSDRGEIRGPDGFVAGYDIGYMAGTQMHERRRSQCIWSLEHRIANRKALTGVVRVDGKRRVITTIFDGDRTIPANFWADLRSEKDLATFLVIVTSYEPPMRR